MPDQRLIGTEARPLCPLCGGTGDYLYQGLSDRLFGAPGRWNLRQCGNDHCRLLWLDPMPVESDLAKLYSTYYTHHVREGSSSAKRIYRRAIDGYLRKRFGYGADNRERMVDGILGRLLYLHPGARAEAEARVMSVPAKAGGRLLEIGFGNAQTLLRMKELGWQVEGVEFDPVAVGNARALGLDVHLGSLSSVPAQPGSFDAVVSSHVIEHVPDPLGFLRDCHRLLKKSGLLVAYSPNTDSLGHRLFGRNWRGLEPPRHLHLFNSPTLLELARRAGFSDPTCRGTPRGGSILLASLALSAKSHSAARTGGIAARILTELGHYVSWAALKVDRDAGEEIMLIARKGGGAE